MHCATIPKNTLNVSSVCVFDWCSQRLEEGVGSLRSGVMGGFELSNMGDENRALAIQKSGQVLLSADSAPSSPTQPPL